MRADRPLPALSRALLTPGPLPPLSHLGATLLRHGVGTALRYAFYQLDLPLPEAPPVRIVRLRLYLDGGRLEGLLAGAPGGPAVAAALLDPAGAGTLPPAARRLAAAATFHRVRLALRRPLPSAPAVAVPAGAPPDELWRRFQGGLSRLLPRVGDALLADLLSALDRRAGRARGRDVPPALGLTAARLLAGRRADLGRLGAPDLLASSWADRPGLAEAARAAIGSRPLPPHRLRGSFRETWRAVLTRLGPLWNAYAAAAATRGLVDAPEDACFLPFDLAGDLAQDRRPAWLDGAVRANRAERDALLAAAEPPERMADPWDIPAGSGERPEWGWAPLLPLP